MSRPTTQILVVEDEPLVAMHLEDVLSEMGLHVVGPAARIDEAIELARNSDIDCAVLDINLGGSKSFPVADILRERGIPFIFATGYGAEGFVDRYRNETALHKPYDARELKRAIEKVLGGARGSDSERGAAGFRRL